MKKSLAIVLVIFLLPVAWAVGENDPLWHQSTYEKKVVQVGQHILQANHIGQRISFLISNSDVANAYGSDLGGSVIVEKNLLNYVDNDDELAAVLSHEIAHILNNDGTKNAAEIAKIQAMKERGDYYNRVLQMRRGGLFWALMAKKNYSNAQNEAKQYMLGSQQVELHADEVGLGLMTKAGYNPHAMATLYAKILGDGTAAWKTHPIGSDRINRVNALIAVQEKSTGTIEPEPSATVYMATPPANQNYIDELEKLNQLLKQGVITQSDFDAKKKQLLGI